MDLYAIYVEGKGYVSIPVAGVEYDVFSPNLSDARLYFGVPRQFMYRDDVTVVPVDRKVSHKGKAYRWNPRVGEGNRHTTLESPWVRHGITANLLRGVH